MEDSSCGGNVSRVYTYSQDGDLLAALVDGLLTTFVYDGKGNRLQMSVDGEVVTYTLDYAGGFRILLEEGGEFSDTKHYLYGLACLGEQVDADEPETAEWRYYQRDAKNLLRQTSDQEREITFAWTYSPTGGVLMGEKGPVTYLDCGDNAIYDWSTGLIFKRGRYFDPTNSLWITLGGIVIWQTTHPPTNQRYRRGKGNKRRLILLLLALLLLALVLAGCDAPTPGTPTSTPCPTPPTATPGTPTVPPTLPPTSPPPTDTPPPTSPPPAVTPQPTPTDTPTVPPPSPPTPEPPTSPPVIPTVDPYGTPFRDPVTGAAMPVSWPPLVSFAAHPTLPGSISGQGIDIVPGAKRAGGPDAIGIKVVALHGGLASNEQPAHGVGPHMVTVKEKTGAYEIVYSHIIPEENIKKRLGVEIAAGTPIGEIMDIEDEDQALVRSLDSHLHLGYRSPATSRINTDPSFLITERDFIPPTPTP